MPRYLVERLFHVSIDEMPIAGRRSKEVVVNQFPEITWEHSHVVVDEEGAVKTYCVYAAPNEEIVQRRAVALASVFHATELRLGVQRGTVGSDSV